MNSSGIFPKTLSHELQNLLEELEKVTDQQRQQIVNYRLHPILPSNNSILQLSFRLRRALSESNQQIEALAKELSQLRKLQEIGAIINSSLEMSEVLNLVMDSIVSLLGAERAFLMLIDEETGQLEIEVARNINRETIETATFDISRTIVKTVFETGEPVVTTNALSDPRFASQESIINYNLRSILCVPLQIKNITLGAIYADSRISSSIFVEADRNLLAAFANQAASVIENARLFRQIRDQLSDITEMKYLMDDIFESIASGVITIDLNDRISMLNRAAERILGVSPGLAVNQSYQEVLVGVSRVVEVMVQQVKRYGGTRYAEVDAVISRNQTKSSLALNCSPLRDVQQETLGVAIVVDDVTEKKRLESVRRYLPPALVEQVRDIEAAQRPQRQMITVMFADVRGFSTFSENLYPEQLIEIINGYFTVATQAINQYDGVIDKFMGDAVMALFNTTLNPQPNHVERAVRAAWLMQMALAEHHAQISPEQQLYFGIGIHCGEAVVGNVGSRMRKDFSAIGDTVNLAKRIQELATPAQILLSSAVYEQVKDWVVVAALPLVQVKGRKNWEQVYELKGVMA